MREANRERELRWLRMVRDLAQMLNAIEDLQELLPKILDAAVQITGAERGFLVRLLGGATRPEGVSIKVEAVRGFDRGSLESTEGSVSRTVVLRVLERGDQGLVTTTAEDADVMNVSSVQARQVSSILCVPLRLRQQTIGVLYLDHSFEEAAFSEADLPVLMTFAAQAALAIETATLRTGKRWGATVPVGSDRMRGESPAMQALRRDLAKVARSDAPVLILGESGTGKELAAREIHALSSRAQQPFLAENCAAISETLLEGELFGCVKGSYTGATEDRLGLFEQAGRGTLLLDEVGDMSHAMQAKLLRVLQEHVVRPLGSSAERPVRCRIVAATNRDLPLLVADGRFREDLYYRLDVLRVQTPPLRARGDDVLLLARHFLAGLHAELQLSDSVKAQLCRYAWPGNVRQLRNEIQRLCALCRDDRVRLADLSEELREGRGVSLAPGALSGKTLAEVEKVMVAAALKAWGGNKLRAARQLGIPRSSLYDLIKRYGLSQPKA